MVKTTLLLGPFGLYICLFIYLFISIFELKLIFVQDQDHYYNVESYHY